MKREYLLWVLLIVLLSCSPEENLIDPTKNETEEGGTEYLNISAESTSVYSYQVIKLSSTDAIFLKETYPGFIGDIKIIALRETDRAVKLIIPDLNPGDYNLKLKIEDNEANINLKINNPEIPNLEETLAYEVEEPFALISSRLEEIRDSSEGSEEIKKLVNSSLSLYSLFVNKYAELSPSEKIQIAKFLKVNPLFSDAASITNQEFSAAADMDCFIQNSEFLSKTAKIIRRWNQISDVILIEDAKRLEAAGAASAIGIYLCSTGFLASQELLINTCKRPVRAELIEENNETQSLEAFNNTFKSYNLKFADRGLNSSDINDPSNLVSSTVKEINNTSNIWNTTIKVNPSISSTSSWLNQWIGSNNMYNLLPPNVPSLPISVEEEMVWGNTAPVNITNLPSDVTVELLKEENGIIKLKINAPENSLPRSVSGAINYNDGSFQFESPFQIKLSSNNTYKIQFGDYRSDYALITPYMEISPGDAIKLGNGMFHMIRFILNGEPLINPAYPENQGWGLWDFGSVPFTEDDVLVADYKLIFSGPAGENVEFPLALTYSNSAYRSIVGKKVNIQRTYSGISGGIYQVTFHGDNKYTVTDANLEFAGEGTYEFVPSPETLEVCPTYTSSSRENGSIRLGGLLVTSPYPAVPPYIGIYPDNSFRYGCIDDPANNWKISLIN